MTCAMNDQNTVMFKFVSNLTYSVTNGYFWSHNIKFVIIHYAGCLKIPTHSDFRLCRVMCNTVRCDAHHVHTIL